MQKMNNVVCGIVRKGVSAPISKSSAPLRESPPPFLIISHPTSHASPTNQSTQVFLIDGNATVKLSLMNTNHVKQQHNVDFFIFKFNLKYMLDNVYINKIHARQCL